MSTQFINNGQWLDKPDGDGWWWHWEIHSVELEDGPDICIVQVSCDNIYYGGYAGYGDKVSSCGTHGTTVKWQRVLPHSPTSVINFQEDSDDETRFHSKR